MLHLCPSDCQKSNWVQGAFVWDLSEKEQTHESKRVETSRSQTPPVVNLASLKGLARRAALVTLSFSWEPSLTWPPKPTGTGYELPLPKEPGVQPLKPLPTDQFDLG